MTEQLVVDASAALAWLLREADSQRIEQVLLNRVPVVPALWRLEVANVLLVQERRGRLSQTECSDLLGFVDELKIELQPEPSRRSLIALAELARPHQLTSYDAVYLELALARNLPLLTLDKNLQQAANRVGTRLL